MAEAAVGVLEAAMGEVVMVESAMEVAVEVAVMDPQESEPQKSASSSILTAANQRSRAMSKPTKSTSTGGSSGWGNFLILLYLRYTRPDVISYIVDCFSLPALCG